jgi:hypothetical protein
MTKGEIVDLTEKRIEKELGKAVAHLGNQLKEAIQLQE